MSYATPQDIINRYPNRDLVQLTNEDPTVTTINTASLQQALDDASAEIDGYLAGRFTLPLTEVPEVLSRLVCDVAIYRLQSLRPVHDLADARLRYDDAIAMLAKVASGAMTLGIGAEGHETQSAQDAEETSGSKRIFSRKRMRGF